MKIKVFNMSGDTLTSFFVIASRRRGNLGGAWDCFGTSVPRNDIRDSSLRAPSLTVILREQSDRRISPLRAGSGVAISVGHGIASALACLAMT